MSTTICFSADALGYPQGGGHCWVYMNYALSLQALGCRVIWLERVHSQLARQLAETYFDGRRVVVRVLEDLLA